MPPAGKFSLIRVVAIGLLLPILLAFVDNWLLTRELFTGRERASEQAMAAFVFQVGLFGVLCGRLLHPAWLRWVLFAWCLLFTDLTAASSLSPQIAQSLFTAQIGLVTVWVVLGTSSWKIRAPFALLMILPMLGLIAQTAALCLICLVLRSQHYQLALANKLPDSGRLPGGESNQIQFGIKDVLLWMTALAPLLAVSRLGAWQLLGEGVLHAIVLVIALWTAIGRGSFWLRWPLLALVSGIAGTLQADFDLYITKRWQWFPPSPVPFFSGTHLDYLFWRWDAFTPFFLASGMMAATLLIYRVLGYRLCRQVFLPRRNETAQRRTVSHPAAEAAELA
jgi:hypothetical protein